MADITINLFSAIVTVLVIGVGYLGLSIKHKLFNSDFKKLDTFDKIMQSLILGTITLIASIYFSIKQPILNMTQENIISYIIYNPSIFLIQIGITIIIIEYWILGETAGKKLISILRVYI
jgi:hypothetical protein